MAVSFLDENYECDSKTLEKLVMLFGPTGNEDDVQRFFSKIMKPYVDHFDEDNVGNVYAIMQGDESLPRLLFNAHADNIAFMVEHVGPEGFIAARDLSYDSFVADYNALPSTSVLIRNKHTNEFLPGRFQHPVPFHELPEENLEETYERYEHQIDVGILNEEEAKGYVEDGDYISFKPSFEHRDNFGHRFFIGTNLDDRVGELMLYEVAKNVRKMKLKRQPTIYFVSTTKEESFIGSAAVAGRRAKADISLTFDVTAAVDTIVTNNEETIARKHGKVGLKKGPVIPYGVGIDRDVSLALQHLCRDNKSFNLPYQIEVAKGNSENEQLMTSNGKGVKASGIFIPARYTHTNSEMICFDDVEYGIILALNFINLVSQDKFKMRKYVL